MNMVYAQQSRRLLDRLIGFTISPLLWKHIQNSYEKKMSLSAGRVQSVVLKLIIERESDISKFESKNTYKINSIFVKDKNNLKCDLNKDILNKEKTIEFLKLCQNSVFSVDNIKKNKLISKPHCHLLHPLFSKNVIQNSKCLLKLQCHMHKNCMKRVL